MYDKIEDTIEWLTNDIKVLLTVSVNKGDNIDKKKNIFKTISTWVQNKKSGLKLQITSGLNIEYSRWNDEKRLYDKESVLVTSSCWYSFLSGLISSVKLFDKIIVYYEGEPYTNPEIQPNFIEIKNFTQGKSINIVPCIHENIKGKDSLNDTPIYYPGFEIYINNPNYFVFVEENKFKSFVYNIEKFDLISSSRLLFNNALLIDQLGI